MKVLLVSTDDSKRVVIGGKHIHQELLEKGLKSLGISVYTAYYNKNLQLLHKLSVILLDPMDGFRKILGRNLSAHAYIKLLEYKTHYFRSVKIKGYDIIHCHDTLSLSQLKYFKNIVLTLHGYAAREVLNYSRIIENEKRKIYDYLLNIEKQAISKAKYLITVDSRLKKYAIEELGYPKSKITVLYNAIDTDRFIPVKEDEKLKIRQQLGWPMDKMIVLIPRRYVKKNGVIFAAKAFSKMKDEKIFFVFVGRGPLKKKVQEILKNNKNALVLDGVSNKEIPRYYQASDVVLIPSITSDNVQEATSLSMLEGMACGKVVICTNIGGMAEVVKNGENGILIPEKNVEAIIETLKKMEKEYENFENIRVIAREYVVKKHSYLEYAKKILKIYDMVLNSK